MEESPNKKVLILAPGVSWIHLTSYLIGSLFTICFFVFLNASQGFVLGDILHLEPSLLGSASGDLVFYDELCSMFLVYLWGLLSDLAGRNIVWGAGYLFTSAALFAYPWATSFEQLLGYRMLFAVGGSATSSMLTAVLADISTDQDRGKMAGIAGFMTGLGALIALFVFLPLPAAFGGQVNGLRSTFLAVASISLLISGIVLFGLYRLPKGPPTQSQSDESVVTLRSEQSDSDGVIHNSKKETWWQMISSGFGAGKDPLILLGYVAAFMARADSVIISTFLPLWVYKYYLDNGLCDLPSPESPDVKTLCNRAYILASILSGIAQTFALIGAPLFGYLSDKFNKIFVVSAAALMGGVGYVLLFTQSNPNSGALYAVVILLGLGEIGLIVTSLTLVTSSSIPSHLRGSIAGISSFFGAAGILLCTKLGGYLFDSWDRGGPFVLAAGLHGALFLVCILVFIINRRSLTPSTPS